MAIAFQVAGELCPDEADDIRRMWLFAPAGNLVGILGARGSGMSRRSSST